MRITDLFVRRPVLALVVNLVILIAGLQSVRALSAWPRTTLPFRGPDGVVPGG